MMTADSKKKSKKKSKTEKLINTPMNSDTPDDLKKGVNYVNEKMNDVAEDNGLVEIDKAELESLEKDAALYDEFVAKCEALEQEIKDLQLKHNISEEEMKKIEENIEVEAPLLSSKGAANVDEAASTTPISSSPKKQNDKKKSNEPLVQPEKTKETEVEEDIFKWMKENKTVPSEWVLGISKQDSKKRKFRSPEGFLFDTRVKALEFMIKGDYPENVVNMMRLNLSDEGWYNDKSCPGKWKLRKIPGVKDYEYLSPSMEVLPSMQAMLHHLQTNNFSSKEIKNLETKISNIDLNRKSQQLQAQSSQSSSDASSKSSLSSQIVKAVEEPLPGGWTKKKVGDTVVYVSPVGTIVHTLQQVLASMEKTSKQEEVSDEQTRSSNKRKLEGGQSKKKKEKLELEPSSTTEDSLDNTQTQYLEDIFKNFIFPDSVKIEEICSFTNLSQEHVKAWFIKRVDEEAKKKVINTGDKDSRSLLKDKKSVSQGGSKDKSSSGSKTKLISSFNDMTKEHKKALEEIFKVQAKPTNEMLAEVSTKLKIDLNLLSKWFSLRSQQKKKS